MRGGAEGAEGAGARLLVRGRGPADRRGGQRGAGHRGGRAPGRAVERRPRGARRQWRTHGVAGGAHPQPPRRGPAGRRDRRRQRRGAAVLCRTWPASWPGPVVVAGNVEASQRYPRCSTRRGRRTCSRPAWCRRSGCSPRTPRAAIREMFLRHVIGGKHLSQQADFTAMVRGATPDVVLTAVELLAHASTKAPRRRDVVVVDIGGATTDVRQWSSWTPRTPASRGRWSPPSRSPAPSRRPRHALERGVHGPGGPGRRRAPRRGERPCSSVPPRYATPSYLPGTPEETAVDEAIAAAAVAVALRRRRAAAGRVRTGRPGRRAIGQGPARGGPARRLRRRAQQPARGHRPAARLGGRGGAQGLAAAGRARVVVDRDVPRAGRPARGATPRGGVPASPCSARAVTYAVAHGSGARVRWHGQAARRRRRSEDRFAERFATQFAQQWSQVRAERQREAQAEPRIDAGLELQPGAGAVGRRPDRGLGLAPGDRGRGLGAAVARGPLLGDLPAAGGRDADHRAREPAGRARRARRPAASWSPGWWSSAAWRRWCWR